MAAKREATITIENNSFIIHCGYEGLSPETIYETGTLIGKFVGAGINVVRSGDHKSKEPDTIRIWAIAQRKSMMWMVVDTQVKCHNTLNLQAQISTALQKGFDHYTNVEEFSGKKHACVLVGRYVGFSHRLKEDNLFSIVLRNPNETATDENTYEVGDFYVHESRVTPRVSRFHSTTPLWADPSTNITRPKKRRKMRSQKKK